MWTQAGFTAECKSPSDAEKAAKMMKEYLKHRVLFDDNWEKGIFTDASAVELREDTYTTWEDWDGLFEDMCENVEALCPGLLLRGESVFSESTGGRNQVAFERTDDGIEFARRMEDYDAITQMLESGLELDEIAEITGMSLEEIGQMIGLDEDE